MDWKENTTPSANESLYAYLFGIDGLDPAENYEPWVDAAPNGGLRGSDFICLASNGFGDPQNSYAFSMAWYGDELYVGTVRNMLALVDASPPPQPTNLDPWPVRTPRDLYSMDQRAQIWRYKPVTGTWSQVYVSPIVDGRDGKPVPRDIGYRYMVIYQGRNDDRPMLYVASASSNSRGLGTHLIRFSAEEGETGVSPPILGDPQISTLRELIAFKGRLYMSPTGKGRAWNAADRPCVYETDDPMSGEWRPVSEPFFGDDSNEAIYAMAVYCDHLYVGTLNPKSGYQIWKTRAEGNPPYEWKKVIENGAYRGNLNEGVVTMCVFKGGLYVGSGISNGGRDRTYNIGPAAGEIIKIYPDDSWDLIVGTPRDTPAGEKRPRSGMGPGFNNPFAGYIWNSTVHNGWLYVGTFDSLIFALWGNPKNWPAQYRQINVQRFVERRGGFELWRTEDGLSWFPVTRNGFGNPYNYGVRTIKSTPIGLMVGTANPFAPEIAMRLATGWEYVPNPRGGTEIWAGGMQDL